MTFRSPKNIIENIRLRMLYKKAFPREERKPFSIIMNMKKRGKTDVWYFEDNGIFLGLATTINGEDKVLIDYFAVAESKRGHGNGGRMLKALIEYYSPRGVFLEIEIPYEDSKNYSERVRRKEFYLRAGLTEMGTKAKLFGVDMELLGTGFSMTFDEYRAFYLENYGKFAYNHINRVSGVAED